MGINLQSGWMSCFACSQNLSLEKFASQRGFTFKIEKQAKFTQKKTFRRAEFSSLTLGKQFALDYLKSRNLTPATQPVGSNNINEVYFPVLRAGGTFSGEWLTRHIENPSGVDKFSKSKFMRDTVIGEHTLHNVREPVYVFESVFEYLRALSLGVQTISTSGKFLTKFCKNLLQNFHTIGYYVQTGQGGETFRESIKKLAPTNKLIEIPNERGLDFDELSIQECKEKLCQSAD